MQELASRQQEGARRWRQTRATLVAAACELTEETWVLPSAESVAHRAELPRRSVFHHFDDRQDFALAVIAGQEIRMAAELAPRVTEGSCEVRLQAFVSRRGARCRNGFTLRSALLNAVQGQLGQAQEQVTVLSGGFGTVLGGCSPPDEVRTGNGHPLTIAMWDHGAMVASASKRR
ncbi:MAG: TetR/AcrR family transcriptional regulator [Acidimicrobiales bacterium]